MTFVVVPAVDLYTVAVWPAAIGIMAAPSETLLIYMPTHIMPFALFLIMA